MASPQRAERRSVDVVSETVPSRDFKLICRPSKPRIYPTYKSWAQPEISHGRMADLRKGTVPHA